MEEKKVVIIGGGPSGYAAAIYLARARIKMIVLAGEQAGGQLMFTTEVENYPGFKDGVMGPVLMQTVREQAEKFGAEIKNENVTKVDFSGEIKKIWTGEILYQADAVIVSTGAKSRMLNIGEEKFLGRGVSTCAVCDAAFFKGKNVAVVGAGDAAMEDVMALKKFASKVYLIHRREELRASKIMQEKALEGVELLLNSEIISIKTSEKLEGITIKNNKTSENLEMVLDGLFLAIGHLPSTDLFKGHLELDERGYLMIKMMTDGITRKDWLEGYPTQTSVVGVFGAGDVADVRYKQAATASGMGVQAALDAEKFLTGVVSGY
jgi:thioredoxin reductase (NADPH)